jgi:hypothetical protein
MANLFELKVLFLQIKLILYSIICLIISLYFIEKLNVYEIESMMDVIKKKPGLWKEFSLYFYLSFKTILFALTLIFPFISHKILNDERSRIGIILYALIMFLYCLFILYLDLSVVLVTIWKDSYGFETIWGNLFIYVMHFVIKVAVFFSYFSLIASGEIDF